MRLNRQSKEQVKKIVFRFRQKNILIVAEIFHHLNDSLRHTPGLITGFHDRPDAEIIVPLYQMHILL